MMENNNLLLYKLLCKDKVGDAATRVTVGKGKRESEMKEQMKAHTRGKCSLSNVLLCMCDASKTKKVSLVFGVIKSTALSLCDTVL